MAEKEKSTSLALRRSKSAQVDWFKRQNNMSSRKLELELERLQKEKQIWLKEQEFEHKKLKATFENQLMKKKMRSLSSPNISGNERPFASFYRTPQFARKQTFCDN